MLSPKRKAFVRAYLGPARLNGAEAYRQAGYQASTVSTATSGAHKLVTNGDVKAYIDSLLDGSEEMERLTPNGIRKAIMDVVNSTNDAQAKLRGLELIGRSRSLFKDVIEDKRQDPARVLDALRGTIPPETLAELAEQHGLDPSDYTEH